MLNLISTASSKMQQKKRIFCNWISVLLSTVILLSIIRMFIRNCVNNSDIKKERSVDDSVENVHLLKTQLRKAQVQIKSLQQVPDCEIIHVAVVCRGHAATRDVVILIKSILFNRKRPLHFHFISDSTAHDILKYLFKTWEVPSVTISFYSTDRYQNVTGLYEKSINDIDNLYKLTLPMILSSTFNKIIWLDPDTIVNVDIAELWELFKTFVNHEVIGAVKNQNLLTLRREERNLHVQEIFNEVLMGNPTMLHYLSDKWILHLRSTSIVDYCLSNLISELKFQYTYLELSGNLLKRELQACTSSLDDKQKGLYPYNYLRNIALENVNTPFVFLSDVDFLPLIGMYKNLQNNYLNKMDNKQKKALVIPAFEQTGLKLDFPEKKQELLLQLERKELIPIRADVYAPGHKATDYPKWILAKDPYKISYKPNYEPYMVLPKDIPKYDTRFVGFGWDKASHTIELDADGYEFVVLPDLFIVHIPHAKTYHRLKYSGDYKQINCVKTIKKEFLIYVAEKYGQRGQKYQKMFKNLLNP
ncbi:hypothetical protein KUTeg_012105 [Tegillarca granosa]|uniref:Uncharacterized protein n=1 Tax=Tegillarca granosa TaxID=220873 RepID=A0ABQ9F242_TEGGR|nr:hypothetical protein KUTeg_012105 [Tegillarca granosa]